MASSDSDDEFGDVSWGSFLAVPSVVVAALALALLPVIVIATGAVNRPFPMAFALVAFVVAWARLVTMLWGVAAFVGDRYRRLLVSVIARGQARLSLAAVMVVFALIAIPHC